ncbi:hypothetical protein [uncultured Roseibium sp.]|uniref:hypothetical protein n=1 Tax=uncultured Roseibium sp. TaxID=1936171 RepID=UPI002602F446|nr:hypothetical protein [uncultured Roseibium sp.]
MSTLPKILEAGKTPEQWAKTFAEHGIEISARTLRDKARKLSAYCGLGNAILLKPEHIDRIFEDTPCRLKSTNEEPGFGSEVGRTASMVTLKEASKHLIERSQPQKSRKSRGKRDNVRSLVQMRRQKQTS